MRKVFLLISLWFCLLSPVCFAQSGITREFDFDWKFVLNADYPANALPETSDADWHTVQLPHDWSISQNFHSRYSGSNGHLPGGVGWYRKHFSLTDGEQKLLSKGGSARVLFDGIYHCSEVYLNGHSLGFRAYGFGYIEYNLTLYLNESGNNVLAVRVNTSSNSDSVARWYTGAGIYRHAHLKVCPPVRVETYGIYVTTPRISSESADIQVRTLLVNDTEKEQKVMLQQQIFQGGRLQQKVPQQHYTLAPKEQRQVEQTLTVLKPQLWDVNSPNLYQLKTTVQAGGAKDIVETPFGIRTCEFTPDRGFLLNGRRLKLHGFCLHQDDASLGAALPLRSMERKLEICKAYGVNAIRCSHNQPAPEFLDLCDRMGFVVIDEAFDKWKSGYYAACFDDCWQADLQNMLQRDRNHPSVVLWSIGNELKEAWDESETGVKRARMLQDFVHAYEPSRQVCLAAQNNHQTRFAGVTDVIGYNYLETRMIAEHKIYPERRCLVTEELPYYCGAEGNIRSYDTTNPWELIAAHNFIAGGFIWTGTDYIGEAGWPSHGWPTGLFDICMVEKPRAAYHRAMWNPEPMVSIAVRDNALDLDHGRDLWQWPPIASMWNFPKSYQGLVMEVLTTTNCERVVLYQNAHRMGEKRTADFPNHTLVWNVPYKPGKLEAVGLNGPDTVARFEIATAGEPVRLQVIPDRQQLSADGQDLSYVQVALLDQEGRIVQHQSRHIKASIKGEGKLMGFINSDLRRKTPFTSTEDETYFGRAMAIVQTTRQAGTIVLQFEVEGFARPVVVELTSK